LEKKHCGKLDQKHYFPLPSSWYKQYYSSRLVVVVAAVLCEKVGDLVVGGI
jgi:hypothetical protein